jgi:hypothetical protein
MRRYPDTYVFPPGVKALPAEADISPKEIRGRVIEGHEYDELQEEYYKVISAADRLKVNLGKETKKVVEYRDLLKRIRDCLLHTDVYRLPTREFVDLENILVDNPVPYPTEQPASPENKMEAVW